MARNLVNLKSVAKGYASRTVLDGVTLGLEEGERIGMVGENGAGKTTLMRLIAGAEEPDRGVVTHYEADDLDAHWHQTDSVSLPGLPSRTRLSPDGTLAASTVFVNGDSYITTGFSTRTVT